MCSNISRIGFSRASRIAELKDSAIFEVICPCLHYFILIIAVPVSREIILCPVRWVCMTQQPFKCARMKCSEIFKRLVEILFCSGTRRFKEKWFELWVLEFLVHILVQVAQAISMWRIWKRKSYAIEKSFLMVGDKG